MATTPIPLKPSIRSTPAQSLLGSAGAAASLLLPKCPLCWMALSGSFAAAGYAQRGFEIGGLAIFLFALWRILRRRSQSILRTTTCLAGAATVAACGAWLNLPREARVLLWVVLIATSLWLARSVHSRKCDCKPAV